MFGAARGGAKGHVEPWGLPPRLGAKWRVEPDPGADTMPPRVRLSSSVSAGRLQCALHSQAASGPIASRRFCPLGRVPSEAGAETRIRVQVFYLGGGPGKRRYGNRKVGGKGWEAGALVSRLTLGNRQSVPLGPSRGTADHTPLRTPGALYRTYVPVQRQGSWGAGPPTPTHACLRAAAGSIDLTALPLAPWEGWAYWRKPSGAESQVLERGSVSGRGSSQQ